QDSNNVVAANNLGWLIQDSDPKRAVSILLRAEKLSPSSADIADTAGWVMLRQKDPAGALKHLERAHALRPGDQQITYHYAAALSANAKRDQARGILKTLLAKNVRNDVRADAQKLYDSLR
ncbi:MAG: tetratricopeptide repeat protein, partial [Rhizomicrobium sp.]